MRPVVLDWLAQHGFHHHASALVPTPGGLYALTAIVLLLLGWFRLRTLGIDSTRTLTLLTIGTLCAMVGARAYFMLTRGLWSPQWVTTEFGTASWGAYTGAMLGLLAFAGAERWLIADAVASFAPLACVVGRWSCFLAGDDFGRVTTLGWGVRFPAESYAWTAQVIRDGLSSESPWSLPVAPTQPLLSAAAAVALAATTIAWQRLREVPGVTLGVFLVAYGVTRFPVEFLRDPLAGGAAAGLSHSQLACLAYVAGGSMLLAARWRAIAGRALPWSVLSPEREA